MLFNYVLISLAIYSVAESLAPLFYMDAGLKGFCHKAKYIMIISTAVIFAHDIYSSMYTQASIAKICVIVTLVLVVWPRMVWRLKCFGLIKSRCKS